MILLLFVVFTFFLIFIFKKYEYHSHNHIIFTYEAVLNIRKLNSNINMNGSLKKCEYDCESYMNVNVAR
jgi:hypothetical protein